MKFWKLFPFALVVGCTSVDSGNGGVAAGSPAWFATASPEAITNYFRKQCVGYGYMPGTPEMASCIQKEAVTNKQSNVARSAAIASATAGY
jgi:hypothetical protein